MMKRRDGDPRRRAGGFTLVATLLLLVLLAGLTVGLLSLSAVELKSNSRDGHRKRAEANARLALMLAIGQLQRTMGPDTRVSAGSGLVAEDGQRHWTGVWDTLAADGKPWVRRDGETWGLTDLRESPGYRPREKVMGWLVSGGSQPERQFSGNDAIVMVGKGSVDDVRKDGVSVPTIKLHNGRIGWWTGDLGLRANVGVSVVGEAFSGRDPESGESPLLASGAASELIGNGVTLPDDRRGIASEGSAVMVAGDRNWGRNHFHDFTVHTKGLPVDVREGGWKKDLTGYLEWDGMDKAPGGVSDDDRLVGPPNEQAAEKEGLEWKANPFVKAAPRFGVLRNWARLAVEDDAVGRETVASEANEVTGDKVLANHRPVNLKDAARLSVQPVLVEASQFYSVSWFEKPGTDRNRNHLRMHLYPRVVLWNPYAVKLKMSPMMVMLQICGRRSFWVEGYQRSANGRTTTKVDSPWVMFHGGRSNDYSSAGGSLFMSEAYRDPNVGSFYYHLAETDFAAGECLVFSPEEESAYRMGVPWADGDSNLIGNRLSPDQRPDPSRCLTIDDSPDQPGFAFVPTGLRMEPATRFFEAIGQKGASHPGDDLRVILKDAKDKRRVTAEEFDSLPQIAFVSGCLQYGAGRWSPPDWRGDVRIAIENTTGGPPTRVPDGRTREGLAFLKPRDSEGMEALAAWNPRAAYSLRCPWGNLRPGEGHEGYGMNPWGFGIYQRHLPEDSDAWFASRPEEKDGRFHVHPLGKVEANEPEVWFDLPRKDVGVFSLGYLQHAKLSDLVWHPSAAVGNSLAVARLGKAGLSGTVAAQNGRAGFRSEHLGVSADPMRSPTKNAWRDAAVAILQNLPDEGEQLVYDMSYEVNHALWDRFYVSGATGEKRRKFVEDPASHPLGDPRLKWIGNDGGEPIAAIEGAFNVNSTSVDAWAAVLGGARRAGKTSFPRTAWIDGSVPGHRSLTDGEIRSLATEITEQVKLRGPFVSMADFVNRRLASGTTGEKGAIEAAIHGAGINSEMAKGSLLMEKDGDGYPDEIKEPLPADGPEVETAAWGHSGFLTQADILQKMGNGLVVRSDTFVIRAYGESRGEGDVIESRAWCEAVLQRKPEPVGSPELRGDMGNFGRKFQMVRFRWLSPSEI